MDSHDAGDRQSDLMTGHEAGSGGAPPTAPTIPGDIRDLDYETSQSSQFDVYQQQWGRDDIIAEEMNPQDLIVGEAKFDQPQQAFMGQVSGSDSEDDFVKTSFGSGQATGQLMGETILEDFGQLGSGKPKPSAYGIDDQDPFKTPEKKKAEVDKPSTQQVLGDFLPPSVGAGLGGISYGDNQLSNLLAFETPQNIAGKKPSKDHSPSSSDDEGALGIGMGKTASASSTLGRGPGSWDKKSEMMMFEPLGLSSDRSLGARQQPSALAQSAADPQSVLASFSRLDNQATAFATDVIAQSGGFAKQQDVTKNTSEVQRLQETSEFLDPKLDYQINTPAEEKRSKPAAKDKESAASRRMAPTEATPSSTTGDGSCPFSCVAEFIYWRDPKKSGIVFGSGLIVLLSLIYFSIISVFAYTSLAALTVTLSFRIYKNILQAVQKTNEGHPFKEYLDVPITPSAERVHQVVDILLKHFNTTVNKLRSVFLVEDIIDSLKFVILFWCLTYIGSWFNGLTLVILAYLAFFSLPKVYEMHKQQIDQYVNLVYTQVYDVVTKVRAKIPFPAKKEKDN